MLGYLVCVLLVGGSVAVTYHKSPAINCYKYHDVSVPYKLSYTTQGYPASYIREELIRRPHLRAVLYDPATITVHHPQPVHFPGGWRGSRGYPVTGRRYKRSYISLEHRTFPLFPKPVKRPIRLTQPKPVRPTQPKPVRPIQPKPVRPIQPKPVRPIPPRPLPVPHRGLVPQVRPISEVCPSQKYVLHKFWLYGGTCYVINPKYQNVVYARCSKRDCSNCAYTARHTYRRKPVSKCVESRDTVHVWAYCYKLNHYSRIKRVALSLPKYCSCKTYQC